MAEGTPPTHELVDPVRLGEYLNREFGDSQETRVETHVAGFSNITCFVFRADQEYVLRRPPGGPLLPTAHDVAREFRFLSALHGTPARVPRPFLLCTDEDVIGAPFYLMERKHGHVIRAELPTDLDAPKERRSIGFEMVDALAEIHAVDWKSVGLTGRAEGYLDRQMKRWKSQAELSVGKVRELPQLQEVTEWLGNRKPMQSDITVVHGDFKMDNMMFAYDAPARLIAIFDWEMATIGDPLADLGWLMHTWGRPDGSSEDAPLPLTAQPGFATREELAERYAERSGRKMEHFDWYHVLALWKLAIILEGLYVHYRTGTASNPESAAFEIQVPMLIERARSLIGRA
jgi:aminoglycoside phosphotransferase (APT) family kinase protein